MHPGLMPGLDPAEPAAHSVDTAFSRSVAAMANVDVAAVGAFDDGQGEPKRARIDSGNDGISTLPNTEGVDCASAGMGASDGVPVAALNAVAVAVAVDGGLGADGGWFAESAAV